MKPMSPEQLDMKLSVSCGMRIIKIMEVKINSFTLMFNSWARWTILSWIITSDNSESEWEQKQETQSKKKKRQIFKFSHRIYRNRKKSFLNLVFIVVFK